MKRITHKHRLTAEQIAKDARVREQITAELPDLIARHHERTMLKRNVPYPCSDYPNQRERDAIGIMPGDIGILDKMKVVWNGEDKRPPRKGEWYLSGAIIEGYRAPNDLTESYHIGILCRVEKQTTYKVLQQYEPHMV